MRFEGQQEAHSGDTSLRVLAKRACGEMNPEHVGQADRVTLEVHSV
jgi:hypothetical protein